MDFLYEAIGLTSDRELVSRLAKVWAITPEVLCSTADALADLLEPCGRDTTAHALWVSSGLVLSAVAVAGNAVLRSSRHYIECTSNQRCDDTHDLGPSPSC